MPHQTIPLGQKPGAVVSLAAHHHAIQRAQVLSNLRRAVDAAVDDEFQGGKVSLQTQHPLRLQRWNVAVFLGRQALQPGIAGMHDEEFATRLRDGAHKVPHEVVALATVNADAVFHRHGNVHRVLHGFHAIGHQSGFGHQASAKSTALHPLGGATAVEVDLLIAPLLAQLGGTGQIGRFAPTQLQGHRVFFRVEIKVARHIAMDQRPRGDHLGVEQGVARQQAVEIPAVAVGPVHHRRNTQAAIRRKIRVQEGQFVISR